MSNRLIASCRRRPMIVLAALCVAMLTVVGAANGTIVSPSSPAAAAQKGGDGNGNPGSDRPPDNPGAVFQQTTLAAPTAARIAAAHGFDLTGFIQATAVNNASCPSETNTHRYGGTAKINNVTITIPCNLVVQMPANTFTWADFVGGGPSLAIGTGYPSFELHLIGNTVSGKRIAGLAFASQQSLNTGSGVIKGFDFAAGTMLVDDGTATTRVQLNDPKITDANGAQSGRFSAGQSPDPRFSVDQANATIHAGSGYPMCIPRVGNNTTGVGGADTLCPQQNRPKTAAGCRTFAQAGVSPLPAAGDITPIAGQTYCSQFVMPAPPAVGVATTGPDSRQQAPFQIGDYVDYTGTLVHPATGPDYVSAHTVEANVGIYTQPGSKPSYLSIGEFRVAGNDPNTAADLETQNRLDLEAETTDVKTAVDIYLPDVDAANGSIHNRWVTPWDMTSENQTGTPSGGITTQFKGAQPVRIREQATKAPTGLLQDPPRSIRVATRSTCVPNAPTGVVSGTNGTIAAATTAVDACLDNPAAQATPYGVAANGLATGQYTSPTFSFIFSENVKPGDAIVPNDLWHLGFLRFGENTGGTNPNLPSVGPLTPSPW